MGAFWAPFWGLLGCIFEPPRGSILGAMLPSFLAFLPCFFPLLPSSLLRSSPSCLPFLPPQETKTPRSQERKQPRNVATQKLSHLGSAGARVSAYNSPQISIKTSFFLKWLVIYDGACKKLMRNWRGAKTLNEDFVRSQEIECTIG